MPKQCPYKTGDVVEFQSYSWIYRDGSNIARRGEPYHKWVGRIEDIVYIQAEDKFELWMEYLSEVNAVDSIATPDDVIRLIESSDNPPMILEDPPIKIGTTIMHEESGKKIIDKIESYMQCDQAKVSSKWAYILDDSGYSMTDDEFKVVKIEEG
jgi:hypothetical protein